MDKKISIVRPSKVFKIPINLLTQKAFGTHLDGNETIETEVLESRRRNITSKVTIINKNQKEVFLSEFDYAVLNACIFEYSRGNEYTSAAIIFRYLGGNRLTPNTRKEIEHSLEKLATVRIHVDAQNACKKGIIRDEDGSTSFSGYLLPNESLNLKLNGQVVLGVHILSGGIISYMANLHDQIISCPIDLLQAPVKSTPRNIALNHYLLRRTLSIKGSNELAATNKHITPLCKVISFDDLYKQCGVDAKNKRQRQEVRETTEKILQFLVKNDVIADFRFVKKDGGFYSIEIFL